MHVLAHAQVGVDPRSLSFEVTGVNQRVLRYLVRLSRLMELGLVHPWFKRVPLSFPVWFQRNVRVSGLEGLISKEAYCEARMRGILLGMAAGGLVGAVLSNVLAVVGLGVGAAVGCVLPKQALQAESQKRAHCLEKELPDLLEVTALGLRSGMSFDRSFSLYTQHFDTSFSRACARAQNQWELGLKTKELALRELSATYEYAPLRRVIDTIVRSLRFGSSLSSELEQTAAEVRALHKAHRQEEVAKAPVKMMIPTGTLILPAMLLLVLGPVLLEMAGGFS